MALTAKLLGLAALAAALASAHEMPDVAGTLKRSGPGVFVYNPTLLGANHTKKSSGGLSQPRQQAQWMELMLGDISQTYFKLEPCALRPPHTHQFASGLLYVISGANLSVGIVTETGMPIVNQISTGASALFPVGLIHYQANLDCKDAEYTISYNKANPGTQVTLASLLKLPAAAVAPALGLNTSSYADLLAGDKDMNSAFFTMTDPDCVARCKANMQPSTTAAGR